MNREREILTERNELAKRKKEKKRKRERLTERNELAQRDKNKGRRTERKEIRIHVHKVLYKNLE